MPSYDPKLFNIDPYYDDYSEDKKFLRLLFRPGYGVQARELTQVQTIIQNQIERFGSHVFEEGSIVLNGQISENRVKYGKVSFPSVVGHEDFIGTVISKSGRANARVVHAEGSLLGSTADTQSVLFFEYIDGGTAFSVNDIISATASNGIGITASITGANGYTLGNAIVASVDRGVRFSEGFFVLNNAQSIGGYSLTGQPGAKIRVYDNPTTRIGFDVIKSIVTSEEDTTLTDPAFGYYNYAAPGSDRFSIDLVVSQLGFTANDTQSVDNFSREGFIEFMRIVDGEVVKIEKYPDYAMLEDTLARRTYDESGNYTVSPFELTLKGPTSSSGVTVLKAELSSGKAYVFGYEFETQARTKLNIPCARGSSHERTITRDFNRITGPFTKVIFSGMTDSFGMTSDLAKNPYVSLSTGVSGAAFAGIGQARIRWVQPYASSIYNLSLYDIALTGGAFNDVTRIFMAGKTNNHLFTLTGSAGLEREDQGCMLYQVPEGSGVTAFTSGDFAVATYFNVTSSGASHQFVVDAVGSPGSGMEFPNITVSLPNTDIMVFDSDGKPLSGTAQRDPLNAKRLDVTVTGTATGKKLTAVATQEFSVDTEALSNFRRSKTSTTFSGTLTEGFGSSLTGDGRGSTSDTLYFNGFTDVFQVLSLTGSKGASSGISLLSYFSFDDGQRDAFYDWSRLVMTPGVTGITGPYSTTVKYYAHQNQVGSYTVQSYPDYENIPTYTSKSTGTLYELRDCIDFRPDRSLSGDIKTSTWIPANSAANNGDFTYTHHLPRTDKIVLTRDRKFSVISGIPSPSADIPSDDPNAMSLYTVHVNPYTFNNDDASVRYVENKRYTMRDIGDLEKRIEAVEYYTTLNILEQETKAKSIQDIDGIEMPKRGILVDQFKGHSVADHSDTMFAASVDYENNELRPSFTSRSYSLTGASNISGITGNIADGIYTLSYTQSPEISNLLASESIVINPFNVINYLGTLVVSPSTDNWFDDTKQTKVKVNVEGENDNWQQNVNYGFGTRYNDWEAIWFGKQNQNSKNNRPNLNRNKLLKAKAEGVSLSSINSSVAPESMKKVINNKTVVRDVLPVARAKVISISAKGLKPNTFFYVFCNDVDVTQYCTEFNSRKTNSNGEVVTNFSFNFVNASYETQNFLVGRHLIRIIDSADINDPSAWTMCAEAVYSVEGSYNSLVEDGHLATRLPETRRKSVKSTKILSNLTEILANSGEIRGYNEPVSQTIYVDSVKYPSGIFVKSIDLYFKSKESITTIPITVQIRPTISGYPHPSKVLPFGSATLYSGSVNVADLITSGNSNNTNFSFTSPVHLLPGQEYAISIHTNSSNYSLLMGSIGSSVILANESDTKYSITKQPMMRSLFRSQNTGKLVKNDNQTLALRLNVCKFTSTGTVRFRNASLSATPVMYLNEFRFNAVDITPEESTITYSAVIASASPTTYTKLVTNKNILPKDGYHEILSSNGEGGFVSQLDITMNSGAGDYVSPVFDFEKSSIIGISNVINDEHVLDPTSPQYNGELEPTNDMVASEYRTVARYISKKVTLEEGLESENITVSMSLCNSNKVSASGSAIKVFIRPIPVGEVDLENINYVELTTTDNLVSVSDEEFREVSYTNIGYTTLSKFKTFSIKVVMLGPITGSSVPRIRNLRMVAT